MRLLLVEPHSLLARSLKRGLVEEGFVVDHVTDVNGAGERVRENGYHLIVLDLPVDAMLKTFQAWRCMGLRTPMLLISEPGRGLEQCEALRDDSCDTSSKPFSLDSLLTRLRNLIRHAKGTRLQILSNLRECEKAKDLGVVRFSATRYTLPVT